MKFIYEVEPEIAAQINNKWVPIEGIRFRFDPVEQAVEIDMTQSLHNAKVVEQFLEPNNGKQVVIQGTLPL